MRTKIVLVASLLLLLGACSNRVSHAPPPLNKQLLTGKWKNVSDMHFIAGYEFAADGTLKMNLRDLEKPIPGRYTWSGERTLDLEYPETADVRDAYRKAARAYKEDVRDRVKAKKLSDKAGPSLLATVEDELPAKVTVRAGLSDKPPLLILGHENGSSQTFEKVQ